MKKAKSYLITVASCVLVAGAMVLLAPRVAQTQVFSSPMRDVDNPARQPISLQANISVTANAEIGDALRFYQVPAGKRLIIEYIGFSGATPIGKSPQAIEVWATNVASQTSFALAQVTTFSPYVDVPGFHAVVASQKVYMFGNPGDEINAEIFTDGGPAAANFDGIGISGYLVNLP